MAAKSTTTMTRVAAVADSQNPCLFIFLLLLSSYLAIFQTYFTSKLMVVVFDSDPAVDVTVTMPDPVLREELEQPMSPVAIITSASEVRTDR